MVYAAVYFILHHKHPVKLILSFIKNIRNTVSTLRNIHRITPLAVPKRARILIGKEQIRHCYGTGNHISSIVTRIMPSACDLLLIIRSMDCCLPCMTGSVGIASGILFLNLNSTSLCIEEPESVLQQVIVDLVAHLELIRSTGGIFYSVGSFFLQCGKIAPDYILSCSLGIDLCIIFAFKAGISTLYIHNLKAVTNLRAVAHCYLYRILKVSNLINIYTHCKILHNRFLYTRSIHKFQ